MEDRFDTDIQDLWLMLTDLRRLGCWYGQVGGDLSMGGAYRARLFASGWEGTRRIEACESPQRLLVRTKHVRKTDEHAIEATLTADGDQTVLILEDRGMLLNHLAAYGAGVQIHVEDLADHIAGQERRDEEARWDALENQPAIAGFCPCNAVAARLSAPVHNRPVSRKACTLASTH